MNWNPANWAITDTVQGQKGGWTVDNSWIGKTGAAVNSVQPNIGQSGSSFGPVTATNPSGITNTQNSNSTSAGTWDFGDGGGGTTSAPVDPYAQWGGQANYNRLVNQFNTQKQGIFDTANEAGQQTADRYGRSILDFLDSARLGQQGIENQAAKNELARMQGTQGVMGMVGRGITSSGVQLANRNAGDSSAAGAFANAYGQLGQRQLANVGNQYEMGNKDVQQAQDAFAVQQASGLRNLQGSKTDSVNSIVNDARNQFAALDAQIAGASLPDRIAIDQAKEQVRQQVLAKLQAFDQQLQSESAKITPGSLEQRRTAAVGLRDAGTQLGADAFNFTTEAPASLQGGVPAGSGLPIYTYSSKYKQY